MTSPLDIAIQIDDVERNKHKLTIAVRYGHADNPEAFASRLKGDTVEELDADAAEFAADIARARDSFAPPRIMAVDPSQAMGFATLPDPPANALGEMMRNQLGDY